MVHCVHCAGFPFSYCVHGVCIVHCVHCAGFFYILAVQVFLFMLCAGFRINVQCYVHVSSSFVVQVFLINFTTLCTFFLFFCCAGVSINLLCYAICLFPFLFCAGFPILFLSRFPIYIFAAQGFLLSCCTGLLN